jgi:RNA polymerase sigma-70 factor (ECF subfamily)
VVASTEDTPTGTTDASTVESAADTAEKKDEAARVRYVLTNLPSEQRETIELAFFEHLSHHEIAARLGQPLGTVKARIRRGLLKLRQRLSTL